MSALVVGDGTLSFISWPAYVGLACERSTESLMAEPLTNTNYQRGQITWTAVLDERQAVGSARIVCPRGVYTHFLYFHHPTSRHLVGVTQIAHPVRFVEAVNVLDVDPITNNDLQLSKSLRSF